MSSHEVTYTVTIRCDEMDGTPEETAEIYLALLAEAIHGYTPCDVKGITATEWGQA